MVGDIRECWNPLGYAYAERPNGSIRDRSFIDRHAERHCSTKIEIDLVTTARDNSYKAGGSSNYMFGDLHLENTKDWEQFLDNKYWGELPPQ